MGEGATLPHRLPMQDGDSTPNDTSHSQNTLFFRTQQFLSTILLQYLAISASYLRFETFIKYGFCIIADYPVKKSGG